MRGLRLTVVAVLFAAPAHAGDIDGVWKSEVKDDGRYLHIQIGPCTNATNEVCGTIAGAFGGANEANIGKPIIWGMVPSGENEWDDGTIWKVDDDKEYDSEMKLQDDGILRVSGCIAFGMICKSQEWTRVP